MRADRLHVADARVCPRGRVYRIERPRALDGECGDAERPEPRWARHARADGVAEEAVEHAGALADLPSEVSEVSSQ